MLNRIKKKIKINLYNKLGKGIIIRKKIKIKINDYKKGKNILYNILWEKNNINKKSFYNVIYKLLLRFNLIIKTIFHISNSNCLLIVLLRLFLF